MSGRRDLQAVRSVEEPTSGLEVEERREAIRMKWRHADLVRVGVPALCVSHWF